MALPERNTRTGRIDAGAAAAHDAYGEPMSDPSSSSTDRFLTTRKNRTALAIISVALLLCVLQIALLGKSASNVVDAKQMLPLWLAPGLGLGAVFLWRVPALAALPLCAAAVLLVSGFSAGVSALVAAALVGEAALGAYIVRSRGLYLGRVRDVLFMLLLVSVLTPALVGILAIAAASLFGLINPVLLVESWLRWLLADLSSIVVFFPVFLALQDDRLLHPPRTRFPEAAVLFAAASLATVCVLTSELPLSHASFPLSYLLFPFAIWAALRFGQNGTVAMSLLIATIGTCFFEILILIGNPLPGAMLYHQLFVAVMAATALVAGAVVEERASINQRRATAHAVTRILWESESLQEAGPKLLEAVCRTAGWRFGAIWEPTAHDTLRCRESWDCPDAPCPHFQKTSWKLELRKGQDLPGRVWEKALPVWIADVLSEARFDRLDSGVADRLRGGFAIPIILNQEFLGVIEFFGSRIRIPDLQLLELMGAVGQEVGQFIERTKTQSQVRKLNRDMQQRLQELETLMNALPAGVAVARDKECSRVLLNAGLVELLELTPVGSGNIEVSDVPYKLEYDGERLERSDFPAFRAIEHGSRLGPEEHVLITPAGKRIDVLSTASPLRDADGEITGCIVVHVDISEKKQAEQQMRERQRFHRAIEESIDFGVWVCAPDGKFLYVSDSLLRLLGITAEEFAERGYEGIDHPTQREHTIAAWRSALRNGTMVDLELRVLGQDGTWHPILARGVPVRDDSGTITHFVGIHLDISRLKSVEERLIEALHSKDNFLAMLGHELRNPLAAIMSGIRLLSRPVPAERQGWIKEMISRQAEALARLIDDLLDVSRLSRGKLKLERTRLDLRTAVTNGIESIRPSIEERGQQLEVVLSEEPLFLEGDPGRLAQVVGNLLSNASKYSENKSMLWVKLERTGDDAVLTVRDKGAGISREMLPHIFDLFTQAEQTLDRSQGGLGLGLSLVRSLVEMQGGKVDARSEGPGKGSVFTVSLPLSAAEPQLSDAPSTEAPSNKRTLRILVVDDNRDAADSLAYLLAVEGHTVKSVYNGTEVLAASRELKPDVILLDIGLPGKDGYEVAREIRGSELSSTALIAMTGFGQQEDIARSKGEGFIHHLVKPVDAKQLHGILAELPSRAERAPS